MGLVAGPHDSIVKSFFANTEDAASALASALPNAIAERIDWTSLRHANVNLVDRKLREFFSDIVFTARIQDREVILYVLLEHQSTNDPLMPFRMLRYCVLLWDAFLKDNPDSKLIPALLPVVLHHGRQGWTSPTALSDIIDLPDDIQRLAGDHIPTFRFFLDDLSAIDDETLRARSLTLMMLACMVVLKKSLKSTDLLAEFDGWVDVFTQIARAPNGRDALRLLLEYISVTTDADPDNVHEFAKSIGPVAEEAYMTAAEKLTRESAKKAHKEGRKEGQAELLLRQLKLRFGDPPDAVTARLQCASDEDLARWAERILAASSLDDVFAD